MIKHLKKYSLLSILIFPCLAFAGDNNKINSLANQFMQENNVEGLSIAVINNNQITTYNYGYANELTHTKTSNKTIYRVASFSKTYAATLEALAQIEGKVKLDHSITDYLPGLTNDALKPITVKMLVAHTGSLPFDFNPTPENYTEAIADLNKLKPQATPGSEYSYSNVSIGLNGYILQNVYGQSYDNILQNKIAKPLNLHSTYLHLPPYLESYAALGHDPDKIRPYDKNVDVWFAASSLKSNINDMAKFVRAQFNDNFDDKNLVKAFALVHQNYYCFANGISCEQLGWQAHTMTELNNSVGDTYFKYFDANGSSIFTPQKIVNDNTLKNKAIFIDKTCSGYGMSGYMLYDPAHKVGVVILLNKSLGAERVRLGRDILRLQSL
ncbi:MAG: serine hydrolase [Legionellales bacterium]|nr:serine hydrolase [Legionellales bacterium]